MKISLNKSQCVLLMQSIGMIKLSLNNSRFKGNKEIFNIKKRIKTIEKRLTKDMDINYYFYQTNKLSKLLTGILKKQGYKNDFIN